MKTLNATRSTLNLENPFSQTISFRVNHANTINE